MSKQPYQVSISEQSLVAKHFFFFLNLPKSELTPILIVNYHKHNKNHVKYVTKYLPSVPIEC